MDKKIIGKEKEIISDKNKHKEIYQNTSIMVEKKNTSSDEVIEEDSYYSLEKNSEIFQKFQKSFSSLKMQKDSKINKIENITPKNKIIKKLLSENEVFLKYKIDPESSEIRKTLPVFYEDKVKLNAWAILKSNLGKDLTRVTIPIYFNEPRGFLQSIVSFIEYKQQLEKANSTNDPHLQTALVLSTFFIILVNAACSNKKPFNPLLGETYEILNEDKNFRLISEQVSHHPPISAFYGESDDFIVEGFVTSKPQLTIKGFSIIAGGDTIITLKKSGAKFSITKRPKITIHNYIVGKLYIWNSGDMICEKLDTGEKAVINLSSKGWSSKNDYKAEGFVYDKNGEKVYTLEGRWNSNFIVKNDKNEIIEQIEKFPNVENFEKQYNYSAWGINSNNLTQKMTTFLPPTDSRFRPDQRAFEFGDLKLAADEKMRLENYQRERRKIRKNEGKLWSPNFFLFEMEKKNVTKCVFKGDYWERQKKNDWKDLIDIFN